LSAVSGSRRAFLRGVYLSPEGRATEKARQKPLGPRPPWHKDLPLKENCIDCAHPCTTACEPAILKLHPAEHELAGLPYLDFGATGCTFCKACIDACPIEHDHSFSTTVEIGKAQLNRDQCIAWNEIICQSCSGRCDYQAISTSYQRSPEVNLDLCNGCGICVTSCPVDAISIIY
jgi:ferredoxin-type protein NapF